MLVLTRKKDQSIVINDDIEITILEIQGDQVRIGINAPRNVSIHRKEIYIEIQDENKKAALSVDTKALKLGNIFGREQE